ncbi:MAG: tetratricopeptide repeat protein [Phormidesmis sp.]
MNNAPPDNTSQQMTPKEFQNRLQLYGNLLLSAAKEGSNPAEVGPLHYRMGQAHDEIGSYAEAEIHYRAAAYSFETVGMPELEAQCRLVLGEVQSHLGYEGAQAAFEKALALSDRANNLHLQAQAHYSLGCLKEITNDLATALTEYQTAHRLLGLAEIDLDRDLLTKIIDSIAFVQTELMVRQALELAERIIRFAETPATAGPEPIEPRPPTRRPQNKPRSFPGDLEASQGSDPWPWPRRRRKWR